MSDYACALQSIPDLFSTPMQMKRPGYEANQYPAAWFLLFGTFLFGTWHYTTKDIKTSYEICMVMQTTVQG